MPVEINEIKYLTATEIVKQLKISRPTLWRWRRKGKVPSGHRYRNSQVIFTPDEFEAIRDYAHRVEPIEGIATEQFDLFKRNGIEN